MLTPLKKTVQGIDLIRLLAAFLVVGLVADLSPHPSLGPSFLMQAVESIAQPAIASE